MTSTPKTSPPFARSAADVVYFGTNPELEMLEFLQSYFSSGELSGAGFSQDKNTHNLFRHRLMGGPASVSQHGDWVKFDPIEVLGRS